MGKRKRLSTEGQTYSDGKDLIQLLEAARKPYSGVARKTGMVDVVGLAMAVTRMHLVVGKPSAEVP
jgi:hypothetical protein